MGRADWTDTLELATVNGSITLTLPADLEHRRQSTDRERRHLDSDFPMTVTGRISRRTLEGTIGGGGRTSRSTA